MVHDLLADIRPLLTQSPLFGRRQARIPGKVEVFHTNKTDVDSRVRVIRFGQAPLIRVGMVVLLRIDWGIRVVSPEPGCMLVENALVIRICPVQFLFAVWRDDAQLRPVLTNPIDLLDGGKQLFDMLQGVRS